VRLGDLDALYEEVADHVTSVSVCAMAQQAIGQTDFKRRCLEDILNAPTIDAIPVEWLEWRIMNAKYNGINEAADAFEFVLNCWKEEQEAR
jgi:hypothetical protein